MDNEHGDVKNFTVFHKAVFFCFAITEKFVIMKVW